MEKHQNKKGGIKLPKSKLESIVFSLINALLMSYFMCVYNTTINTTGILTNKVFITSLIQFPIQFIVAFIFSCFIASNISKKYAFNITDINKDNKLFVILIIQSLTVLIMVGLMCFFTLFRLHLFNSNALCNYIMLYCRNFIMAYPLQIFFVGPISRWIFSLIFKNTME